MKTISKLLSLVMISFMAMSFTFTNNAGEENTNKYTLNPSSSKVQWFAEKVTGKHNGTIKLKSGNLIFEENLLVGGTIIMDMTTIKDTDMEGEMAGKLEKHLKSEDFFNVSEHPTATLEITKVAPRGIDSSYKVTANATIKGKTKEVRFNVTAKKHDSGVKGFAEIMFDRTDFDVKYGSSTFFGALGDKTIYDEFVIKADFNGSN